MVTFDSRGQIICHRGSLDGREYTMTALSFSALYRPRQIRCPDGDVRTLTYDQQGEDSLEMEIDALVDDVHYNLRGQVSSIQRDGALSTMFD